jgi:hypothetical protein
MKLLKKESLCAIAELNAGKIMKMTDEQLLAYQVTLTNAVNLFPIQKERLEDALKKMDYPPVLQWLKAMRNSLVQIHADNLAKDCDKQLAVYHDIPHIRHDKFKTFIDFMLGTLGMLYRDIQWLLEELTTEEEGVVKESYAERVREQLSAISELNPAAIERVKDDQLKGYVKSLLNFKEECPAQENGLRGSFKMKNYASVIRWLGVIETSLAQIYADSLMEECRRQINLNHDYGTIRHEKLELFINYFLTSLSLLCEDIGTLKLSELA